MGMTSQVSDLGALAKFWTAHLR